MTIASNTGPLIALAKIDQLALLEVLFQQVLIPRTVHRELLAKVGPESPRLDAALADFLHVVPAPVMPPHIEIALRNLDPGERDAVALAQAEEFLLLIDDRAGRQAAQSMGVTVFGTAGLLIRAKGAGHIPLVRPLLGEIRAKGYWLSDELIEEAARLAGE